MPQKIVNNEVYHHLGERWYQAKDDPIALLRAEARLRNAWLLERLPKRDEEPLRILDLGCGGGFLANELARHGHQVWGVDVSADALVVAKKYDSTGSVRYQIGDAYQLDFGAGFFDVVCAMDFLEHVEEPQKILAEVARVLKPGGEFYFYTFNRNWLSYMLVIRGVDWVVKNAPKNLHVYHLFLKPKELADFCSNVNLQVEEWIGVRPRLWQRAFWQLLRTGQVEDDFAFEFTSSLAVGYMGRAKRGGDS